MAYRSGSGRQTLDQLRDEMNRLFSGFMENVNGPWFATGRNAPAVNMWEQADALQVELEVPGVKADQVDLAVAENELTIKIQRPETADENVTYHRRERPVGSFQRVIRLPLPVDSQRVAADLRNGVLRITLPKADSARPRKINVVSG